MMTGPCVPLDLGIARKRIHAVSDVLTNSNNNHR